MSDDTNNENLDDTTNATDRTGNDATDAGKAAEKLLANPVIEYYTVSVEK